MKVLTTLLLLFFSLSLQASDPDWISSGVIDEYRNSKYLTALGDGNSLEDARKSAYSRLAEQIKVNISSESDIVKEYRSTKDSASQQENVNIRISTTVNLDNVKGVQIVDQYFQSDSNTHFAFAVLNKVKTATNLLFEIEGELAQIRTLHSEAKTLIGQGQPTEGIKKLLQSTHKFDSVNANLELHKLFAKPASVSLIKTDVLALVSEIDESLTTILGRVEVLAYNAEKSGSPELGVDEPYEVEFSYQGRPLKRVPIKILPDVEDFNIESSDTTNANGMVSVKVRSFPYSGREYNRIKVGLAVYENLFADRSPSAELFVMLTQKSNVSILLTTSISGINGDQLAGIVDNGLANLLGEQNYNVMSNQDDASSADYFLQLRGTVITSPGINGLYFTRIDGVLNIKSAKSNRLLKTLKIDREATKAGGLHETMAAEKSAHLIAKTIQDNLLETLEANLGRN